MFGVVTLQSKQKFLTAFDLVFLYASARHGTIPPLRRLNSAVVLTVADVR